MAIRAANGTRTAGIRHCFVNSHFAPGFTRKVKYGILDLPGYDGLIGMGFLTQFQPFSITVSDANHSRLNLTIPKSGQLISVPGVPYAWQDGNKQPETHGEQLEVQFQHEPPSQDDLRQVLSAFYVQCNEGDTTVRVIDAADFYDERPISTSAIHNNMVMPDRMACLTPKRERRRWIHVSKTN